MLTPKKSYNNKTIFGLTLLFIIIKKEIYYEK